MKTRIYLLPLWLRLWHWSNAVLIVILTVTGASLHFSDTHLTMVSFARAAQIHDIAGMTIVALYVFFLTANAVTGNWWQYIPKPPGIMARSLRVMRYYAFGIMRGERDPHEPTPDSNFNDMQASAYFAIMYLVMPVVMITGLIFLFPLTAPDRLFGLDGLFPVAVVHYMAGAAVVLFAILHVYLGTLGHTATSQYKTMITGWHEGDLPSGRTSSRRAR
ncbi:MAG: cytochrome b/b6 domain-containing protein [Rhodoplanes sp.]|uniref:cytochrome b/b6 domain-containing protein n=1 Tax=Rhodoplanes sp. TaxID=1968906 RepID=UPI00180B8D3E|nr:cytochrome b/b6 domain-containing protein [Rhodoplanes sp.]NVO14381.1 cytochrome b/b6 domain-containing protein [Rhodoplanes sp.]